METMLTVLLIAYILYAIFEFFGFVFKGDDPEMKQIQHVFENGGERRVRLFDNLVLLLMLGFMVLLAKTGIEHVSFITGLLVDMALLMTYMHRFSVPLPPKQMPKPPLTALKLMTYSIHANPGKAWRELILMALLFGWGLYMLVTRGF